MIGVTSPKHKPGRVGPGNHRRPKRCTDVNCPSRDVCKRSRFDGEDGNFHWNRGGADAA